MSSKSDNEKKFPTFSRQEISASSPLPAVEPDIEGYKIDGQLGEGGMGTVWRAVQISTGRHVALKVTNAQIFGSQRALARFQREVELAARLEHSNIARVYDSGVHKKIYYYAMELIEGLSLNQYVFQNQLDVKEVLKLFYFVCTAMQYAHQRGVIHRDLKPSNILVTDDGQPHILDFGLAKDVFREYPAQTVSLDGDILGTPAFMSPEQAAGRLNDVDTRTDVYSLGVILYHLLTNNWPYDLSGTYFETLRAIQEDEPRKPSAIDPSVKSDLEAILLMALDKNPSNRYQTVTEFGDDVQSYLHGRPVKAQAASNWYLLRRYIARHRVASLIVGLLSIIIVSNAFIGTYSWHRVMDLNSELGRQQEEFQRQNVENEEVVRVVVFSYFIRMWNAEAPEVKILLPVLKNDTQVYAGALFLYDPRPFEQKVQEISSEESSEDSFWQYIFGEHHLKEGRNREAIAAFKKCVEGQEGVSEPKWYQNLARTRLKDLSNEQK